MNQQRIGGKPINIPSKQYALWEINSKLHLPNIHIDEVTEIIITIFAPDKRPADLTNKVESLMDLMVKGQIIKDDNWFVVPKITLLFGGVEKENPRAEIKIIS